MSIWRAKQDAALQDQHTDAIIAYFNKVTNSTTLASPATSGDKTITLTSTTGTANGKYIILFSPALIRFTTFFQIGAAVGNVITLDGPMDAEYPAGTYVDIADIDMSVDGSGTTQVFGLRGIGVPPGIESEMDVTRLIFQCQTSSPVTLGLFGNISELTNGLHLRKRNGIDDTNNILNFKTNNDIANAMYDLEIFQPKHGINGFSSRLTFGGQSKIGVVIRLCIGEDLEFHIQDDLLAINRLVIIAEGHIVD